MLGVFRDSGFAIRSKTADGCVDVCSPRASPDGAMQPMNGIGSPRWRHCAPFSRRAIAVIGASRDESNLGRRIFDALSSTSVPVYPVNPAIARSAAYGVIRRRERFRLALIWP